MSRVPWFRASAEAHFIVALIVVADGPPGGDELPAAQSLHVRLSECT
jgi:hypothetical protein